MMSAQLQAALFARLSGDPAVAELTAGAIHDQRAAAPTAPLALIIGETRVEDRSALDTPLFAHELSLTIIGRNCGYAAPKALALAVQSALAAPLAPEGATVLVQTLRSLAAQPETGLDVRLTLTLSCLVAPPLPAEPETLTDDTETEILQ